MRDLFSDQGEGFIADKVLLMNDVDHNPCGTTGEMLTEAALARLQDAALELRPRHPLLTTCMSS